MTDSTALARIRDIALALPETEEREGGRRFCVTGQPFVDVLDDEIRVKAAEVDGDGWQSLQTGEGADWEELADRIAISWELAAPRALLEAGGR